MQQEDSEGVTRRSWLASIAMFVGLFASYGLLVAQGLAFLLPRRGKAKTRLLFAGQASAYAVGAVQAVYDLEGNQVLVRRSTEGFEAFSTTCPHLGCKVRWEGENKRFFCPCHNGIFDASGRAIAGPPADAGQELRRIPIEVRQGVVYLHVRRREDRRA